MEEVENSNWQMSVDIKTRIETAQRVFFRKKKLFITNLNVLENSY